MSALGPQFDQNRIDAALAVSPVERRTRLFAARKEAARKDATHWALRVEHSSHEDLQRGITNRQTSHVLLSRREFPDPADAEQTAYLWGTERNTYPTRVRHV